MIDISNGILLHNRQLLMARRSDQRPAYPGMWSFPGGRAEEGEDPEQTMLRELREEIGITPTVYAPHVKLLDERDGRDIRFHLFTITEWDGEVQNLGDEHSELRWMAPTLAAILPDLALPDYVHLLLELQVHD